MSNIGSNISAGVVATWGIFKMNANDFNPYVLPFYLVGIIAVAFLVSFAGEWIQDKTWRWMQKFKDKKHGVGLGNRYF